jgi:hypothetical protein
MVLGPNSGDRPNDVSGPELVRFNDSYVADVMDELFFQLGRACHVVHHPVLPGDDDSGPIVTDHSTLVGRDDITSAMVDALRQARASDRSAAAPGLTAPHPDQLGVIRRSGDEGAPSWKSLEPSTRGTIDTAMVAALRQAHVTDPRVPDA